MLNEIVTKAKRCDIQNKNEKNEIFLKLIKWNVNHPCQKTRFVWKGEKKRRSK